MNPVLRLLRVPAVVAGLVCVLARPSFAQAPRFDMVAADGPVHASLAIGNTLYIGGEFQNVGTATGAAVPLDSVSGLPQGFPRVLGRVYALAPDGAGGWYVGGTFAMVGGQPRGNLAHVLADNTVAPWNPNVGTLLDGTYFGTVRALVVIGNTVYVGGQFIGLGGQSARNNIGAVDATTGLATSWNPNTSGYVYCFAAGNGVIYAGGAFAGIGGAPSRTYAAALDPTTGLATSWAPDPNGPVNAIAVDGGTVYLGGSFLSAGGQNRHHIAAISAATGLATANEWYADNTVDALVMSGGRLYAGGYFAFIGGQTRVGIAALDPATGSAVVGWNPDTNGPVHAIAVSATTVYAGGEFTTFGGQPRLRLAAASVASGAVTSWNPRATNIVRAIATNATSVMVAGEFLVMGGAQRRYLAAIDLPSGSLLPWNPGADNTVKALATRSGVIYAGGHFGNVGGQPRIGLAAIDATSGAVTSWIANASAAVHALAIDGNVLYAGGEFGGLGGQPRSRIGAVDATSGIVTGWNPGADSVVDAIVARGSTVYAGGSFTHIGGQPRSRVAQLSAASGLATGWNPSPTGSPLAVHALTLDGGVIYVGGEFSMIGGATRPYLAAIDTVSGLATSWSPQISGSVQALSVGLGVVFVGGNLSAAGGQVRRFVAAVDAITGQASSWNPDPMSIVRTLTLVGDTMYLGGYFNSVGGWPQSYLAGVPAPMLAAVDTTVVEGTGGTHPITITVRLLPASTGTVTVHYATQDGTAAAPGDYAATSGTLTFLPGETAKPVSVSVVADQKPEIDETFSLVLSNATGGATIGHSARITILDDDAGAEVRRPWAQVDGSVYAMAVANGTLYIGGHFATVRRPSGATLPRLNLAAIDIASGEPTPWNPGADFEVYALQTDGATVWVGGQFTNVNGQPRNHVAALDAVTGAPTPWDPNANGSVWALARGSGVIWAGGEFGSIGGQSRTAVAALDSATGLATSWNANVHALNARDLVVVDALLPHDGLLYAGGRNFGVIGGQPRSGLAELDANTALATSWAPDVRWSVSGPGGTFGYPWITSIARDGNNVYVGGRIASIGTSTRTDLAAIDATTGLATSWNPNLSPTFNWTPSVHAVFVHDGLVYAGGWFTAAGGQARRGFAALDETTAAANGLSLADTAGYAFATDGERIFVGGTFDSLAGHPTSGLACLAPVEAVGVPPGVVAVEPALRVSPNPTRGSTILDFALPRAGHATITVFDLQGRVAARPVDGVFPAGAHHVAWKMATRSAGVYFVRLEAPGVALTRKVIAIR